MQCMICNNHSRIYFHKQFNCYGLKDVEYWKCDFCGFVFAKTLFELSEKEWIELNSNYHSGYQGKDCNPDDPKWIERIQTQAEVIARLVSFKLIGVRGSFLDYGCGDGKLSDMLKETHAIELLKYDRFMNNKDYLAEKELGRHKYGLVLTTSVFEHLRDIRYIEEIDALVAEGGVLGLHTLVAESIPSDPDWFYLLPVHCSFYTNESMKIIFDRLGYTSSIYNVESRLWFWFRERNEDIEDKILWFNNENDAEYYCYFKRGFVDYWKLDEREMRNR